MIAPMWMGALRLTRAMLRANDSRWRRASLVLVRRLVQVAMPVYLLPALLAVLMVGVVGILVLAVAAPFTNSTPRPRSQVREPAWAA
jgi:hypothetical protein